ncbi:MAG: hypothetical protein H6719_13925 [Sandaracinaceae bacterium]|nr:hypothetical protein [Sandaracinaceae bacterium]
MSEEGSDLANRWPLALGVLALAGVGVWWLLSPGPEPPAPAPPEPEEEVEVADAPPEPEPVEAPPAEPEDFDPDRLARILLDGGTALEAEEAADLYDPPAPTRGVEEPIEVAAERMRARAEAAAERPAPAPREPLTPQQELRQATFWRGMLDDRINAMREQVQAAERAGDDAAATRARRVMQRLEAQRPAVNRQIENLQGQVEPDAP